MSETITVSAAEMQYEEAITTAMIKLKDRLGPEAQVHRLATQCEEMRDWHVHEVEAVLTPGEQQIVATVTFQLAGSDL